MQPPLPWLPVLSNIEPSALRRKAATHKLVEKIVKHDSWPIQRSGVVVWMHVFAWMVDILNINFEPLTFCCFFTVLSILASVNVIDINMCNVLILVWNVLRLCLRVSHYGSNITNVWWIIFTPLTLAFSCEVVHEKLWKSVNICKSYSKKISGTFFLDTVKLEVVVVANALD